jgi:signal transduction histidine kinase
MVTILEENLYESEERFHSMVEANRQRIALLAMAAPALDTASLDLPAMIESVARRTAETIGDACAIALLTGDHYPVLGASYHPDPQAHALLQAMLGQHLLRIGAMLNDPTVLAGQPLLLSVVAPEQIRSMLEPQCWRYLERLGIHSCMIVPLRIHEQLIGIVAVVRDRTPAPYTEHDQICLQALADRAAFAIHNARLDQETREAMRLKDEALALAIQNARLFEQVRAGRERLQILSRQLVRAQEDERRRLAHELHDEIGQSLTAAQLNLQVLSCQPDRAEWSGRLEDSLSLIDRVLQQVRTLSLDLRPAMLDDLGLVAALRWYVHRQAERASLVAHFVAELPALRGLSELETICFRIAQEALTNVVRHARARHVSVELRPCGGELHLTICDDGIGFDVVGARSQAAGASLGLLGMQERALLIGGQIAIESAPGRGTTICARFPLPGPSGQAEPIERRKARR